MSKRFTDTDKWKKSFFRSLQAPYKLVWIYLLDECNHAGIWNVEFDVLKVRTGFSFSEKELLETFNEKITVFDNGEKWFIKDFIDFQYGVLNEKNKAHNSVLNILSKYKIKGLTSSLEGAKDKDKDKDKDMDKDKDKTDFEIFNLKSLCLYSAEEIGKHLKEDMYVLQVLENDLKLSRDEIYKLIDRFLKDQALNLHRSFGEISKHLQNWSKKQEKETSGKLIYPGNINKK